MAKRRYGKKRSGGRAKPSLISMVPLAVPIASAIEGYTAGGAKGAIYYMASTLVPVNFGNGKFDMSRAAPFYLAVGGAYVAKKLVGMSGVNRAMKGLPFRL